MLLLKQVQHFYIKQKPRKLRMAPPQKLIALLLLHSSNALNILNETNHLGKRSQKKLWKI